MKHGLRWIFLALLSSGCAASNYDFDALPNLGGDSRGTRLSSDLVAEREDGDHNELFDIAVIPGAYTHLNVFTKADEEGIPEGFLEIDLDSYLPIFGFVDATVRRYDDEHRLYEKSEYDSYLWGLFRSHQEEIETSVGLRKTRTLRFLWFFDWTSSPEYVEASTKTAAPTEARSTDAG